LNKSTGILILGFNRPDLLDQCLNSIVGTLNSKIYVHIDGPRQKKELQDMNKIERIREIISEYEKKIRIETNFQSVNLGIRRSVPFAVDWVLKENDSVIVIEDDLIPSPHALKFCMDALVLYEENPEIGAISGFAHPSPDLAYKRDSDVHLSIIPESYMWATWKHKWINYSDEIFLKESLKNMFEFSGIGDWKFKLIWQLRALQAKLGLVDTWAYRWVFSLWQYKKFCIGPNYPISVYKGEVEGTHTLGNYKKKLVADRFYPILRLNIKVSDYDKNIDLIYAKKYLGLSILGILQLLGETLILYIKKKK
jgi:hypothetical protein